MFPFYDVVMKWRYILEYVLDSFMAVLFGAFLLIILYLDFNYVSMLYFIAIIVAVIFHWTQKKWRNKFIAKDFNTLPISQSILYCRN